MIYSAGRKKLEKISKVLENGPYEVWIVCDTAEKEYRAYFTLLLIKKHNRAKLFLEILEEGRKNGRFSQAQVFYVRDNFCVLYPCQKERLLDQFYSGRRYSKDECRQICVNLAAECLALGEPWEILYLLLDQQQIYLRNDGSISFGYQMDISRLKAVVSEQECAVKCAGIILWMMEQNQDLEKTMGVKLMQKKLRKQGYCSFAQLIQDIQIDSELWEKKQTAEIVRDFFRRRQKAVLRALQIFCVLLGILALTLLFSQIIAGEFPLQRIFTSSFEKIGTESLIN